MMTLTQKVKKKRERCLMKISETDKWKSKEMMKLLEEERDDHNEEEDDEGENTESVKTYVKSIIPLLDDNDHETNPLGNSSPKGNITIMLYISVHVSNHEM